MELYFQNCQGNERLIAECETVSEVHKEIKKFLDEHESEFFIVKGITHGEYIKGLEQGEESEEKYHQITMDEYLKSLQTDGE